MRRFPRKTITRSLLYIRILEKLIAEGEQFVSSKRISDIAGLSDAQVRKDISNFGRVGRPRVGYRTTDLKKVLEEFISKNVVHVVLFGAGNLGTAVLKYPKFQQGKIRIIAAFDKNKRKIGRSINGVPVYDLTRAREIIKRLRADIAVIAVPEKSSQQVASLIVSCGVKGIINFSPASISVPKSVHVRNIDLSIEFLSLSCVIQ